MGVKPSHFVTMSNYKVISIEQIIIMSGLPMGPSCEFFKS
jgi:hypothetical protein